MTTLTMAVILIVIMTSYVFFICWIDKIYDQEAHNFYFPEKNEVKKQDETYNQKEE